MSEKLAAKHKNSLALKEKKLLQERSETKNCCRCSKPCKLATLWVIIVCLFIIYWIILCPLIVSAFNTHNSRKIDDSSIGWLVLTWIIAFIIWLLILLFLILIWNCMNTEYNDKIKLHSYGTSGSAKSLSSSNKKDHAQNIDLSDIKEEEYSNDLIFDKNKTHANIFDESRRNTSKKHRDLPPLVIHRRNSGIGIEKTGTVNVEENDKNDEDEGLLKSGNYTPKVHRESMKDYLKLVTVTPDDEVDLKSPKGPLSPRDLFFIDLIREAEKAERSKANDNPKATEGKHFFPRDFSPTEKNVNKPAKDLKKDSVEVPVSSPGREATYFIANVESPKSEKTEVFLEIEPDPESVKQWSVNLNDEKPVLTLQENVEDKEDENTEGKVVLFEV